MDKNSKRTKKISISKIANTMKAKGTYHAKNEGSFDVGFVLAPKLVFSYKN